MIGAALIAAGFACLLAATGCDDYAAATGAEPTIDVLRTAVTGLVMIAAGCGVQYIIGAAKNAL
jgi:hypothetical protein